MTPVTSNYDSSHPNTPQLSTAHLTNNSHGLRAQLQNLLPKHALFYAKIEIHQITSVPLVHGEFAVRWKLKHAQNKIALRKVVKNNSRKKRSPEDKEKDMEEGKDKKGQGEEVQETPIPSVVVSDVAEHMGYTGLTGHLTVSPSPLASRTPSTQSSAAAASVSTTSPESTSVNLAQFLRLDSSVSASASSSNPGSSSAVVLTLNGTPNNGNSPQISSAPGHSTNPTPAIPTDLSVYSPSRGITPYNKLIDHSVSWNYDLHTILKIPIDRETSMLEPSPFKLVVTQRVVHGDPDAPKHPRLGAVYLDLSEYAGVGDEVERRYLLAECRMNVVIKLTTHLIPLTPDINYTCPPLPKAEILNGVTDILDTDIDIFHTRPRGLDLWAFYGNGEDYVETVERTIRVGGGDADREDKHRRRQDAEDIHREIRWLVTGSANPSPNSSPNSKTKKTWKSKGKEKERAKPRSRSRSRWARKFGFDLEFTDSEDEVTDEENYEDDDYSHGEGDYSDHGDELYYSSPEEDEEEESVGLGLHVDIAAVDEEDRIQIHDDSLDTLDTSVSIAETEAHSQAKRSKSSQSKSSHSNSSNGHGQSKWKPGLFKPLSNTSHSHPHPHSNSYTSSTHRSPSAKTFPKSDVMESEAPKPKKKPPAFDPSIDAAFDVSKLPFAYGPKTTELLIEALFNPVAVVVPKGSLSAATDGSEGSRIKEKYGHDNDPTPSSDKDKTPLGQVSFPRVRSKGKLETGVEAGTGAAAGKSPVMTLNGKSPKLPLSALAESPFATIVEVDESELRARKAERGASGMGLGLNLERSGAEVEVESDKYDGIVMGTGVDRDKTIRKRDVNQNQSRTHAGDLASVYSAGSPRASVEVERATVCSNSSASMKSASDSFSGSGSGSGSRAESHDEHGHEEHPERRGRGLGMNVKGWWSKMKLGHGQPGHQDSIGPSSRPSTPGPLDSFSASRSHPSSHSRTGSDYSHEHIQAQRSDSRPFRPSTSAGNGNLSSIAAPFPTKARSRSRPARKIGLHEATESISIGNVGV